MEIICDSVVYARDLESHLLGFYYLVLWKGYLEKENTWEPAPAVLHLRKLINTFYHNYLEKPTATSPLIDSVPLTTRPKIRPTKASSIEQKRGQPTKANGTSKRAKKS